MGVGVIMASGAASIGLFPCAVSGGGIKFICVLEFIRCKPGI